jgi:CSLREA domain-containing protein
VVLVAFVLAGWFLQWPAPGGSARAGTPGAVTFAVTTTADAHAARPGKGKCADRAGRCTLRAAVEAASAEPVGTVVTIKAPAGRYRLTLGSLDLATNTISIAGAGAAATVIQAAGAFRVIAVGAAATAALSRVTITGGRAGPSGYGGGVYSAGQLTVTRSAISGNRAGAGGGIANAGGTLLVSQATITGNRAPFYGGGGIQNGGLHNVPGLVDVVGSTISGNVSGADGGGILNGQNGHPASARNAAAVVRPACPRIRRCAAGRDHGARRAASGGAGLNLIVVGTVLTGNTSSNAGGAIASDGGTAAVAGSTLSRNSAGGGVGGGISAYGSLTVGRSTLSWNRADSGGGIEAFDGGGPVPSNAAITRSTLSHNKALIGGAIDASTTVQVSASTLTANQAGQGAGIEDEGGSVIHVLNSTISGNVGAGIQTYACAGGTLRYTTMDGNSAALILSCPDLRVTGSIVAASTSGANCRGPAPGERAGYNLDSGTSCGFTKATDLSRTNPRLGPLARGGGPTMTQTLRRGSPAINHAGTRATGCPPADQRGFSRPFGPACDVGSVEVRHR